VDHLQGLGGSKQAAKGTLGIDGHSLPEGVGVRCWIQAPDLHQETRTGSDPKQYADVALQQQVGGNDLVSASMCEPSNKGCWVQAFDLQQRTWLW